MTIGDAQAGPAGQRRKVNWGAVGAVCSVVTLVATLVLRFVKIEPVTGVRAAWFRDALPVVMPVLSWILPAAAGFFLGWFLGPRRGRALRNSTKSRGSASSVPAVPEGTTLAAPRHAAPSRTDAPRDVQLAEHHAAKFIEWSKVHTDAVTHTDAIREWLTAEDPDFRVFTYEDLKRTIDVLKKRGYSRLGCREDEFNAAWQDWYDGHNSIEGL